MSRVLVTAGLGMLGHALVQGLHARHMVGTTIRDPDASAAPFSPDVVTFSGIDLCDDASLHRVLDSEKWDVVINAAGMIKQRSGGADPVQTIAVNALLPHRLAAACAARGLRLIHFSTDCVFSGSPSSQRGPNGYRESDPADALDLYGRSKLLGETAAPGCVTLRLSLIGPELRGHHGLLSWFLKQPDRVVRGFQNALFTGITTTVAAGLVDRLVCGHSDLSGLWHVAADPISKYDLLGLLRERLGLAVEIEPDTSFVCDRRLDGSAFRAETGWAAPAWPEMLAELEVSR